MAKKEWYAIRWLSISGGGTRCGSISLDTSFDNAVKRTEQIIAANKENANGVSLVPDMGYVFVIPHSRGMKETPEGDVQQKSFIKQDEFEDIATEKKLIIIPIAERINRPSKDEYEFSSGDVKALIFTTSLDTGVYTIPESCYALPLNVLDSDIGTNLYELFENSKPEHMVIDDNLAFVATIHNGALRKEIQENAQKIAEGRKPSPIYMEKYLTESYGSHGFYSKPEPLPAEKIKDILTKDDDMGTVEITPTGRFAAYQNELRKAARAMSLKKIKETVKEWEM